MNHATNVGHLAHGRDDAVAHGTFQAQWISDHENLLAFFGQSRRQTERPRTFRRHLDLKHGQIGFLIDGERSGDRIRAALPFQGVNFNAARAVDDVQVGYDFTRPDKKTAAANQRLVLRVVGEH